METQGIKYAGSKLKLLPYIIKTINELNIKSVLDGFSGTTRVSQALAKSGYQVCSCDKSAYSYVFGNCFLKADKPKEFYERYIKEMNSLQGDCGWFTETYGSCNKQLEKHPFQDKNLMKLDAIREKINKYELEEIDKSVLLTSLILALDKVDNTIGHFSSYLSSWSARSFGDLCLEVPNYEIYKERHEVFKDDIFNVIKEKQFDLAYYDPPYGSNNEKMPSSRVRYNSYYHFWDTVVLNDKPNVFGKAQRRIDTKDSGCSAFEDYKEENVKSTIQSLISQTNANYILFSYNNNGRLSIEALVSIFDKYGKIVSIQQIDYQKNVMANMKWTNAWAQENNKNCEYLFLIKKFS